MLIRSYLVMAWRNMLRHKWTSLLHVFGLAVGMAASFMLYIYVSYETRFDRFHQHGDQIYRVVSHFRGAHSMVIPRSFPDVGQLLAEQSPAVSDFCRVKNEPMFVRFADREFDNLRVLMTDPSFAEFFSFPPARGYVREALSDPSAVVLSSELAERIFGGKDPMGEVISVSTTVYSQRYQRWTSRMVPVRVGAVLDPLPANTHLQFDVLWSFEAYDPQWLRTFANDVFIYLMIEGEEADLEAVAGIATDYLSELYGDVMDMFHELQPMTSIHFGESYGYDMGPRGSKEQIIVLLILAFFIISIAIINFINLATARSEKRAVEVSIRKVAGASRKDIRRQFLMESVCTSLLAFGLAMVLLELFLHPFSRLLDRSFVVGWAQNPGLLFTLLAFAILVGIIAGLLPAMLFSSYQPAAIMRGHFRGGNRNPLLRIGLVIIQFAISAILLLSIMVFNRQVHFMKNADLGFEAENVLYFSGLTQTLVSAYPAFKAELLQHPAVSHVSAGQAAPGMGGSGQLFRLADQPESQAISITEYRVREDYGETLGLQMLEGKWFDFPVQTADYLPYVVNEAAVRALGLENPVGETIAMLYLPGRIIGVVKDFHMGPLRHAIEPLVLTAHQTAFSHLFVQIPDENRAAALAHMQSVFERFDPSYPFEARYISERFDGFYRREEQNNIILNVASALAIVIAMLGLLGLSAFMVMARKKEIGIRKVLGGTALQIAGLLYRDMGRWVLLATVVSWLPAYYFLDRWLSNYPYRIELSWWLFALTAVITLLIAGVTISGQTWRAAMRPPSEAIQTG